MSKVERSHRQDLADVREMIGRGLVDPRRRFPAIDPPSFRRAVEEAFG